MAFYDFLPQKLSCEDLLIKVIKLWSPQIKDIVDHPHMFLVPFEMQMKMKNLFQMKLCTKMC